MINILKYALIILMFAACKKDGNDGDNNNPPGDYIVETVYDNSSKLLSSVRGLCIEELNDQAIAVMVVDQVKNAVMRIPVNDAAGFPDVFAEIGPAAGGQAAEPWYITNAGAFYYVSTYRRGIVKVSRTGIVSDFSGFSNKVGHHDGLANEAHFSDPRGLCNDISSVYACEFGANCIGTALNSSGTVSVFSGNPSTGPSTKDGRLKEALFNHPTAICTNGNNQFFVAQEFVVRKIDAGKEEVTTLAGSASGFRDGKGTDAAFDNITGIAVDKSNNVYIADLQNCCIRRIAPDGTTTTLAGKGDDCGNKDGNAPEARFNFPFDIAIASNGDLYVSDMNNITIRRIRKK
ncbi:MAG: hypothetical protein KF746_24205 [Chitinophagaceae bacterium]|nr:hypothetical protein [Chitinophagaceae bacterium]